MRRRINRMAVMLPALVLFGLILPATAMADETVTTAARPGTMMETVLFYIVAAATILSAFGVCASRNIVRMAVWLFLTLGSVALICFLLAATYIGAIQLIVYAGGTLILLAFGVMLTNRSPWVRFDPPKIEVLGAALVCLALFITLAIVLCQNAWPQTHEAVPGTPVADIGRRLLTTYVVPFEIAGVLLMIVMVGAAHLARQEK